MSLIDRFTSQYQRTVPGTAAHPELRGDTLRQLTQQAAELSGRSPEPQLPEALRTDLAGKRFPAWREVLLQCARGLSANPGVTARTEVSPDTCEKTVKLDLANGQLLKTTGDVHDAASDGVRLVAAEANRLGRKALTAARARIEDPAVPAEERVALETGLGAAFGAFAERREREAQATARINRIAAAAEQEATEARDRAARARTLDTFVTTQKPQNR